MFANYLELLLYFRFQFLPRGIMCPDGWIHTHILTILNTSLYCTQSILNNLIHDLMLVIEFALFIFHIDMQHIAAIQWLLLPVEIVCAQTKAYYRETHFVKINALKFILTLADWISNEIRWKHFLRMNFFFIQSTFYCFLQ